MSIAIEQLIAELKKLSSDEQEQLVERWNASHDRDAVFGQASNAKNAERPSEIERGAV